MFGCKLRSERRKIEGCCCEMMKESTKETKRTANWSVVGRRGKEGGWKERGMGEKGPFSGRAGPIRLYRLIMQIVRLWDKWRSRCYSSSTRVTLLSRRTKLSTIGCNKPCLFGKWYGLLNWKWELSKFPSFIYLYRVKFVIDLCI